MTLLVVLGVLVAGLAVGAAIPLVYGALTQSGARQKAKLIVDEAAREGEKIKQDVLLKAKEEAYRLREAVGLETEEVKKEVRNLELRLQKREDLLERKMEAIERQGSQLQAKETEVTRRQQDVDTQHKTLNELLEEEKKTLQRIAFLNKEEARELLLERIQDELKGEVADSIEKAKQEAKEQAEQEAKKIITVAIQRFASSHTAETVISTVDLPGDEVKGRIIGKEGRNIKAFQRSTGVELIVDDTPGVVILSSFDNIRREIAKRALLKLMQDGRIHPARIEEIVDGVKKELEKDIYEEGKKTCYELQIHDLHPKIVTLLGRLKYRTSYGQNVLMHCIEVAYLAQAIAGELKLDGALARRCGLLHDIGKAVDQELEGGHPQIGADLLTRFGERKEVIEAAGGHHNDADARFPYTVLTAAADAISASRPGARRDTFEKYVQRLERLESIATSFEGIHSAYAVHAGREIRVMVNPNSVDDQKAVLLARDIANQIEKELKYPGEIKVVLLRERRIVEYAR